MKIFKKRSVQIALCIVALIILVVSGFFLISRNTNTKSAEEIPVDDNIVLTMSPKSIGLKLEASGDKHKVRFIIAKASDIQGIEYQLTYNANSTAEEISEGSQAQVTRGITGQSNITPGSPTYTSSWLILGTQSADVVRYDTGVSSVSITLKITETNNKVYQVIDSLKL